MRGTTRAGLTALLLIGSVGLATPANAKDTVPLNARPTSKVYTSEVREPVGATAQAHGTASAEQVAAEQCYYLTRDVWRSSVYGNRLMQVRNKALVCSDDRVYISETPIDYSQAWGNWGWQFSQWTVNSSGFCSSSHLKWTHLLNARFRYGPTVEVFNLTNQTTFWGSFGISSSACQ